MKRDLILYRQEDSIIALYGNRAFLVDIVEPSFKCEYNLKYAKDVVKVLKTIYDDPDSEYSLFDRLKAKKIKSFKNL